MKRLKSRVIIGIIAVTFILAANLQYAFSEYGILLANSLHINVLAQTNNSSSSGTGSSSSSGTGSGSSGSSSSSTGSSSSSSNFCPDHTFVPNRFLKATPSTETVTSNAKGEIEIQGVVKGGFSKNKEYKIVIETKNCDGIQDWACCNQADVGVTIK